MTERRRVKMKIKNINLRGKYRGGRNNGNNHRNIKSKQ